MADLLREFGAAVQQLDHLFVYAVNLFTPFGQTHRGSSPFLQSRCCERR
jgi:hypothetical protein